ncbi:PROTEIN putative-RELATED [Salix purpurea]|uniref:PROTEIN putative-RELATED n=1 Tax=Salix purpurea TaxID=77065 RepID=A0A9Q0Q439_SALPP|nr:PROTEIN putative-RELATED [Salix purpurea]
MVKGAGCINDGEINYDNSSSRIESKHSHQWLMDGTEAELFPNKKQAIGVPTNSLFTGMPNTNVTPWGNASSFQSVTGHFTERFLDSETNRVVDFDNRSIASVSSGKINSIGRKLDEHLYGNDSPFGLSMPHMLEDPRSGLNYGGIRKVKVSQVKEPENVMPASVEHAFRRVDSNTMSVAHYYDKDESIISMGLAYNRQDENGMSMGTHDRENNIFISMRKPCNKVDEHISISQMYKENGNAMPMGHGFSNGENNTISMGQTYSKSRNKGESTIISFGGYDDDDTNCSGKLTSSYELLMAQPSFQRSEVRNDNELVKSNVDSLVSAAHVAMSGTDNISKKKDIKTAKKVPPNNFPSNVRSLLSTGMLDGVPVKYMAWSQEKELRGVIKGSGYLCGCQTCNFSKVVNAYEFERHATCKTKHPNNHIYFENGKTIYGIVQELRSTPQNMLFEVIQMITGSPINQKSFCLWKESFLAATRELQRIYGKDEGKPS